MTKPRFTPDPLPDGLDPSLASFLQRQFDRMNDWWPKDLEDRVKSLEKSYPYIGGTWPIVDYSTVDFQAITASTATVCDSEWSAQTLIAGEASNEAIGISLSVQADQQYFVTGTSSLNQVFVYKNNGGWTRHATINRPTNLTGWRNQPSEFGYALAFNLSQNRLFIGAPRLTLTSEQSNHLSGGVIIFTGSSENGWVSTGQVLSDPTQTPPVSRANFGRAIAISADESVLAIGAPGTEQFQNLQEVFIYDLVGSSITYRTKITETSTDTGFGNALMLNSNGTKLVIGDSAHGVGATGEVTVWDISSTPTKLQTLSLPTGPGLMPGGSFGANAHYFGSSVWMSPDERSLIVGYTGYTETYTSGLGALVFYGRDSANDPFEYCDYVIGTGSTGLAISAFLDSNNIYVGSFDSTNGLSVNGSIRIFKPT